MRVLLDTHVWIWMECEPEKLPPFLRKLLVDERTRPVLSLASIWEVAIKHSLGKLALPDEFEPWLEQFLDLGPEVLPLRIPHLTEVARLPFHHGDPFDRLLVAQARVERMPIASLDRSLAAYDVEMVAVR